MMEEKRNTIPQIINFTKPTSKGKIRLKKKVLNYLDAVKEKSLYLNFKDEILLSNQGKGHEVDLVKGRTIQLPNEVNQKLQLNSKSTICLIERPNALAIKRVNVITKESHRPEIVDKETKTTLTRIIRTFPEPKKLFDQLKEEMKEFSMNYDLYEFWKMKKTFQSLKARQLLGIEEESDDELTTNLIQERFEKQLDNGSWDNSLIVTAKNVNELVELGIDKNTPQIQKAVDWLLARPQSPHNPGMFFLTDELVYKQIDLIDKRKKITSGSRPRFRKRPRSELKMVEAYDPIFSNTVCGPRIMWPNALVLHILLKLGYEDHERVQAMINTLTTHEWCECGYQHGTSSWRQKEPMTMDKIKDYEETNLRQFKYGGLHNLDIHRDESHIKIIKRITHLQKGSIDEYALSMPTHNPQCEIMTTMGCSEVKDEKLKRFAEAHLWRFAVNLYNGYQGNISYKKHLTLYEKNFIRNSYRFMMIFSKFDHLGAKIGILLSIPWLVKHQNIDGSWGEEDYKESATLGVIEALTHVGFL